jgi:hypothetical protein
MVEWGRGGNMKPKMIGEMMIGGVVWRVELPLSKIEDCPLN